MTAENTEVMEKMIWKDRLRPKERIDMRSFFDGRKNINII